MFGLRSARGRAILAGAVLIVLLAGVATLAVWRAQDDQQQHDTLHHTSAAATTLEHAQAEFWEAQATLSALILLGDPSLADDYHDTVASLEQNLSQARTQALAAGEADHVATLDDLTERIGHFTEQVNLALPIVLEADPETRVQLASASMSAMVSEAEAIVADLEELVEAHESDAAAATAAADRATNTTLWLLIGLSAAAFLAATGTIAMLIVSLVRPLAALRASARAITSGDPETRARVSGPEEMASLARDFNEMTDALSAKTKEYIATTNLTGDLIAKLDKHGRWAFLNDAACQFFGRPRKELLGTDSRAFVHPEDIESTARAIRETKAGKELVTGFVNRQVTPMGTRVVEWNGYPLFDEEAQYAGIQITGRDITERKRAEEELRDSEERTRLIIETAQDAFISIDARGVITAWNAQAERTFGWSHSEAVGRELADTIIPPQHREAHGRGLKRFLATGKGPVLNKSIEITAWHHDGHEFPVELAVWAVRSGDTYTFNAFVRDISERKRAEEEREKLNAQLEVRAITDGLTGLYNHAHFFQRLAEEIDRSNRYGRGFSILMMDVDNFKQFNDSRGHQAGDEALCLVADCIRTALRRSDIPFRYGGDEFAAMLLHADLPRAQAIAKRMNGCIARRLKELNNPVAASLGLSTGIACFPNDGTTADDLVRIADAALYDAKRAARARRAMQQGQAIDLLASPSGTLDENQQRVLSAAAGSLAAILQDVSMPDILADLDLRTITAVGAAAEIKDPYIRNHQERVGRWAAALAEKMGLSPKQVQEITIAGLLHDLGKVSISEQILNKPGKLTQEEYAKIKEHAALGARVIAHIESLQPLVPIVRHHHERFDGNGYPDSLAGEEIPLEARILSVVDVFDAMTHERSYRKALSKAEAMAELERGAGTQFDPAAVKAFLALLKKRGDGLACPVHATSEARPLVTAKAAGRRKG